MIIREVLVTWTVVVEWRMVRRGPIWTCFNEETYVRFAVRLDACEREQEDEHDCRAFGLDTGK